MAPSVSQGALLAAARWSDRQQLNGLPRTVRSGLRRLILADLKLAQTRLDLMRAKPQACLRARAHTLTTEIARVLVHPPAAQAVLLGDLGGRKKRGFKTVQRLEFFRDWCRSEAPPYRAATPNRCRMSGAPAPRAVPALVFR
jgi:hypothetical protein